MKKRITLLILLLTIGFASVSATLVLNGTVGVGVKNDDFEVIFVEALLDGEESNKATIESNKKSISLNTDKLINVGDKTELVYKVKNNSTQYGANVTVSCTNVASEYISVTGTFDDKTIPLETPVEIDAQEVRLGKITAELTKSYTGSDTSIGITCTIVTSATSKENIVEYVPVEYKEELLNGADPVLADGLVPVVIENDGTVKKADIETEWYNYENKEWANAVILEDESVTYNVGEIIPEGNIESYFVWIPKYSYQLWDLGTYSNVTSINTSKVHNIPIKFGITNTNDANEGECTTPMTSGASGNCKIGDYMTPPAFITMGTNGLWVGKFETGYKGATSTATAQINSNDSSKVEIKPNVYSWRNIQVANAFNTSYNYKRELDSHMMKNTEWGAVAYLQHSKYGSATNVRFNNNSAYITGYAAKIEPTCGYTADNRDCNKYESTLLETDGIYTINYKNTSSQVASTTGNYTGLYDMSGGSYEYVMGVRGNISAGSSGLGEGIEFKYYDVYNINSAVTTFQYRILGDGTSEFGPFGNANYGTRTRTIGSWYSDHNYFFEPVGAWLSRGGGYYNGLETGIFASYRISGNGTSNHTFRIVLAP